MEYDNYYSHNSRRYSDSSLYDEVCNACGARDHTPGVDELNKYSCTEFKRRVLLLAQVSSGTPASDGLPHNNVGEGMNTVNSAKIVTDEVSVVHSPFTGPQIQIRPLVVTMSIAKLADSYLERMISGHIFQRLEDGTGILSEEALAKRACDLASAIWKEFDTRGWLLDVPVPIEQAAERDVQEGVSVSVKMGKRMEKAMAESGGDENDPDAPDPGTGHDKVTERDSDVGVVERTGEDVQKYTAAQENAYANEDAEATGDILEKGARDTANRAPHEDEHEIEG